MTRIAARLRRSEEGFTLIELLVVVAIIALLATFAVPKLFDAINRSKKAPGQADMQTISSALERYYFDTSNYPIGANAATITGFLSNGYVKVNTTYKNGFGRGYFYVSDAAGSFYVLVDGQNQANAMTLTCGTHTATLTPATNGLVVVQVSGATAITAADVAGGCSITAPAESMANGTMPASVITN